MNNCKPLTKSIIMDFVPKEQRARWMALESVNGATFSGSALVGGYLVDSIGFEGTFLCTAVLQALSLVPLAVLLASNEVPNERDANVVTPQAEPRETEQCMTPNPIIEMKSTRNGRSSWQALPTDSEHGGEDEEDEELQYANGDEDGKVTTNSTQR